MLDKKKEKIIRTKSIFIENQIINKDENIYCLIYSILKCKSPEVSFNEIYNLKATNSIEELEESAKAIKELNWTWNEIAKYFGYASASSLLAWIGQNKKG